MRLARQFCLLALALAAGSLPGLAQDPQKIIQQYVKAAGGSKALAQVRTLALQGSLQAQGEAPGGTFTFETRQPNRSYLEIISGETRLIEAFNGKSAWRETHSGQPQTLLGPEGIEIEALAAVANTRLLNLKKNKLTATFVGWANVEGRQAAQVEIATPAGGKLQEFFDAQSHLIVKEAARIGDLDQEILFSDYRPEAGIQVPHAIQLRRGADTYRAAITQASVNGTVTERVFDFPRKSQVQLPDLKSLFHEIDENQKAIDKMKESYAGSRTEEEIEYDGRGNGKKRETREYTFFYLQGHEVSTLVKKNGNPLREDEQKKENERVQKRIREIEEAAARREAKGQKQQEAEKKHEDDDDVEMEVFLRACQFVNPRRERFRGQDVLVFDFEGNPDFRPHKLAERIAQKLAGVIWVDEKARDVARLEAHFTSDARIAGGLLVNLQRGSGFAFEQEFLNGEVWLPTYEEAHIGARFLLVKGITVTVVTRYFDYKRFNVESVSKIAPPKQPQ
jgi:hypothetical protein